MQMIIESTTKNSLLAGDEMLMQSKKYLQFRNQNRHEQTNGTQTE
jgi:hypothetical protein